MSVKTTAVRRPVSKAAVTQARGQLQRCGFRSRDLAKESTSTSEESTPQIVHKVLDSPGVALSAGTRALFEPHFGRDFSRVRVHTDVDAGVAARSVNAFAYTLGHHIAFAPGKYEPDTANGRRLLAHELVHVIQQQGISPPGSRPRVGKSDDSFERQAERLSNAFGTATTGSSENYLRAPGSIQRFATSEHQEIGSRAYDEARPYAPKVQVPQSPSSSKAPDQPAIKAASGTDDPRAQEYGALVTEADNFASLDQLEQRKSGASRFPVFVIGRLWDFLGDKTRYLDLAAQNVQHFHPHNFLAWQRWHWHAIELMNRAYQQTQLADRLLTQRRELSRRFDAHSERVRALRTDPSNIAQQAAETHLTRMRDLLNQMTDIEQRRQAALIAADTLSRSAVRNNAFGDHFLTDAFAGGHIVTPRKELLDEYSTKILGLIKVGGVLNCASIPSAAWHDLDNKFGVWVTSRARSKKSRWKAFGDDYAHCVDVNSCQAHLPTGESLTPTLEHAVGATAASLRQLWSAAQGKRPTDLSAVLDLLPRPDLDNYPLWRRGQWELQLRFAAGGSLAPAPPELYSAGEQPRELNLPRPLEAPNPSGITLPFIATCFNALSVFSYDRFVVPMLGRIRRTKRDRFFYGGVGQILSPDSQPQAQPHVEGHTALGSILGGLLGAGIGFLAGGALGAAIGGGLGLLIGALVGGLA